MSAQLSTRTALYSPLLGTNHIHLIPIFLRGDEPQARGSNPDETSSRPSVAVCRLQMPAVPTHAMGIVRVFFTQLEHNF